MGAGAEMAFFFQLLLQPLLILDLLPCGWGSVEGLGRGGLITGPSAWPYGLACLAALAMRPLGCCGVEEGPLRTVFPLGNLVLQAPPFEGVGTLGTRLAGAD